MNQIRLNGLLVTLAVHAAVGLLLWGFSNQGEASAEEPKLTMTTIEASLAYKAKEKNPQPQKKRKRKRTKVKKKGVSRDENKKVEPKKKDEPEEEDFAKQFEDFKRQRQDDESDDIDDSDDSEDTPEDKSGGQFDGSEHGFAETSKGDPYMQQLAADVINLWEVPTLEKGTGTAEACVRVDASGKIVDTKFLKPTKNANIDRSVDLALKKAKKKRDKRAKPVPKHLMDMTTQWICFKFRV